jgi:hypothetical protein
MDNDIHERIARLEEQLNERRRTSDKLEEKLDQLIKDVSRMRSFAAGISFAFSLVTGLIGLFWEKITKS